MDSPEPHATVPEQAPRKITYLITQFVYPINHSMPLNVYSIAWILP
ncbi:MAG: hypothetical protein LC539_11925 [Candidatus Thiodiazotropha sp.]|nr:hypothetical protein [Candidatus Thiodiazotropha sp.]MCM8919753.1 hypothetical protein [Candidatus Thiodiazotropha sp.]